MATDFTIREAVKQDLVPAATVLYNAFLEINSATNAAAVEVDFPSVEVAIAAVRGRLEDESSAGVVAVQGGAVIGVGFIVFGGEVNSLALVSVMPSTANKGVGKAITLSLLEKSRNTSAASIRLVQGAPNTKSFSLYVKFGFRPVEFWSNFHGSLSKDQAEKAANIAGISLAGYVVREMEPNDVDACSKLFKKTLGYDREAQIRDVQLRALGNGSVLVVIKDGTIVGYTTGFVRSGYVIATNEEAAIALYSRAAHLHIYILGQLYPTLLRWALEAGLPLIRHGSFMVLGSYLRPQQGMLWSLCGVN
ncbi:uncharacterized protein LOC112349769 [Selaginella moellendorffii]|uniref:uncharacterized protein LOC112349769 n=1 Tax=Selaginella moellendorffii TaxID=88036 RepID=UPI000D1D0F07|nr:uncharacterized protein LOC112349769 [Selaginella moellendorffii]|eukprot:XP_024540577.1 uncharacterized protein LOC112349769 [Selaginella moellendorffii]